MAQIPALSRQAEQRAFAGAARQQAVQQEAQREEAQRATRAWSKYQADIFAFVQNDTRNAVIEAVAGSGKSTTIVHAMSLIPADKSAVFLAFNKAIAEELKAKGVNAKTFHSLTYSPVTRHKDVRSVETNKLRILVDENFTGNDARMYGQFCQKLVGLGRQVGIGCLVPDVEASWMDIVVYHDLELDNEGANLGRAIELAQELLELSNAAPMVDFDDMLYLPVKDGLSLPKFDFVFVDEAQDTNAIQRALLRKILKPTSRLIAVGDPAQAIYGFRGADSNSLGLIVEEFDCVRLPLTVSYRCGHEIIKYAQQWVKHIEAAPNAAAGTVRDLGKRWDPATQFRPDHLVVCRTTRPLISLAYTLMRAKVPCFIMGKEIGAGMKALINKMKASNLQELETRLGKWLERETEKALAKKDDAKVEALQDKADAIYFLIDSLPETQRHVNGLLTLVDSLFADGVGKVRLCTIHKSKGLEADVVHWLNRSACPSKWAKQEWQKVQEGNLCYVAATRAKSTLYLIEEGATGNAHPDQDAQRLRDQDARMVEEILDLGRDLPRNS